MAFFTTLFKKPSKIHVTSQEPSEHDKLIFEDGHTAIVSQQYDKAIRAYSQIIPPTFDSLLLRGCARLKLCHSHATEAAIEDFDKAMKINQSQKSPKNDEQVSKLYYKRGFAYQSIGQNEHAIENYNEVIRLIKDTSLPLVHITYFNRALAYENMNELEKALKDIEKANELNQMNADYIYCQARIHTSLDRKTDAEADLMKATTIVQENLSQSSFNQGVVLYGMQNFEKARNCFAEALIKYTKSETGFDKADIYFYDALTSYALEEKENAIKGLEDAIECNPNHARAYFRLGMIQAKDFNLYHEALNNYTKAHELAPHQQDILYERGELNFKLGRLDIGINDKRRALQLKDLYDGSAEIHYKKMLNRAKAMIEEESDFVSAQISFAVYNEKLLDYGNTNDRNTRYLETISAYEKAIKADEKTNRYPYARALLIFCQQTEGKLYDAFSQRELLDEALSKENSDMQQSLDKIMKFFENAFNGLENKLMIALTQGQLNIMSMMNNSQKLIKEHETYFKDIDQKNNNQNLITFYRTMRRSLTHIFVAIGIVSAGDETQIAKHDVKGTKAGVGAGIRTISRIIGALVPHGGGLISGTGNIIAKDLEKRDYNQHKNKFRTISLIGDPEELRSVAITVAKKVTDSYIKQIGSLKNENKSVPVVSFGKCTCRSGKWKEYLPFGNELDENNPIVRVATFGSNYTTVALRETSITKLGLKQTTTQEELVDIFVGLVCRAQQNIKQKVLGKAHLDPNRILPHNYKDLDGEWELYEFYQKPGIRVDQEDEDRYKDRLPSYMEPDKYGYRLGTIEEIDNLKKQLEETTVENKV